MNSTVRSRRTVETEGGPRDLLLVEWWIPAMERRTVADVYGRILEETDREIRWSVRTESVVVPVGGDA